MISCAYVMDTWIWLKHFFGKNICIFTGVNRFSLIYHKVHTQKIFEQFLSTKNMLFCNYIYVKLSNMENVFSDKAICLEFTLLKAALKYMIITGMLQVDRIQIGEEYIR